MSADYYRRLEQARVAPPSAQILDALARVLGLTADERDYLYRIADRERPPRPAPSRRIAPALQQLVDGLGDSPTQVMTVLGETLAQNRTAVTLFGDHSVYTGDARNSTYRWFTDPASRLMHPPEEHAEESHSRVAELRARAVDVGDPRADRLIGRLRAQSAEFEEVWQEHKVAICRSGTKTLLHPAIGTFDLDAQILHAEGVGQLLVAFTAPPGSEAVNRLRDLETDRSGRK
jgi:transcriptional regulator with XRE-family HTH domain